jgi:hypothetical protein
MTTVRYVLVFLICHFLKRYVTVTLTNSRNDFKDFKLKSFGAQYVENKNGQCF